MTLISLCRPQPTGLAPIGRLTTLSSLLDALLQSPSTDGVATPRPSLGSWVPPVDLYEDGENLFVKAELPGMKKEDIRISLHDGFLTLAGERKPDEHGKELARSHTERVIGRFQRTLSLPSAVQTDKVVATYQDGMLTVTLPKTPEAKPRQIEIGQA
jgi:HSP20 family protein